jgi:hypothetical protein
MGRTAVVVGFWFAMWMIAGAAFGGYTAPKPDLFANGIYYGAFNGAALALVSSFAWPWIMPRAIDRWMRRGEMGEA